MMLLQAKHIYIKLVTDWVLIPAFYGFGSAVDFQQLKF